jgi:hypothetical protein
LHFLSLGQIHDKKEDKEEEMMSFITKKKSYDLEKASKDFS